LIPINNSCPLKKNLDSLESSSGFQRARTGTVGGIFCNLEKVFDCVNHKILVDKFVFYGIKGKFLALIQSYVRGSYQKYLLINLKYFIMFLLDGLKLQMEFIRV
jgi:hypothetical protein